MNKLDTAKRVAVVSALVEGCSIRSIVRMTGVSKNTIAKLLVELGAALNFKLTHYPQIVGKRITWNQLTGKQPEEQTCVN